MSDRSAQPPAPQDASPNGNKPNQKTIYGGTGHDFYTYNIGDSFLHIEDAGGTDVLVLKGIVSQDIDVHRRNDGFHVVLYRGEPIVEMLDVEYIQTTDGCFSIEKRWGQ